MAATADRVQENFQRSSELRGSYGQEWWLVTGVKPQSAHISSEAQAAGLPKIGELDVYGQSIVYRTNVVLVHNSVPGQESCVVQVDYRPTNWNVSRYLGGTIERSTYIPWGLPVIYNASAGIQGPGIQPYWVYEEKFDVLARPISYRTETRSNPGNTLDQIQTFRDKNLGKLYEFGNRVQNDVTNYVLDNIDAKADRGNNIVVTVYFRTSGPVKAYPANYFGFNHIAIPALNNLESYNPRGSVASGYSNIQVVTAEETYDVGEPVPWL